MANPQPENGTTMLANEIAEVLAKTQFNGYEIRYLWVLWRKTYGWHKTGDVIANSQFVLATGLKKQHIWRTEKRLIDRKIVTKNGYELKFNKDYSQWIELPKLVTTKKVTKSGIGVTKSGIGVTKNGGHKYNYTNTTIQIKSSAPPSASPPKPVKKLDPNEPMTLEQFTDGCEKNHQRHLQIIGLWAGTTKPQLFTRGQWGTFIRRNLRAAQLLSPFSDDQLIAGFAKIRDAEGEGWLKKFTLETLLKFVV